MLKRSFEIGGKLILLLVLKAISFAIWIAVFASGPSKMFKKKNNEISNLNTDEKMTRTVVTETVETADGVQTTRKVITTSSKGDLNSAIKSLDFNLDSEKFKSGSGTSVTKKVVYSSNHGKKEVVEETVETFDDELQTSARKNSKPLIERLGLKSSKSPSGAKDEVSAKKASGKETYPVVKPGKFEEDCLAAHNAYRLKHGVPKLKLSKQICGYSKEWADHLAGTDTFKHRTEKKYGENIFMKWSSDHNHVVTGNEAVDSWYSEIKDHTFGQEPRSLKSGHFTQVIWRESKEMGVAWSRSKNGKVLVVANYDPPGNFIGRFAENVPPPKN